MRFLRETENLEDIPEEFQSTPEIAMAMELAQESAYTPEELEVYDECLDAIRVHGTVRADSFEEGREEEKKNMVRIMLQEGIDIQKTCKVSSLSEKEVTSLA